jgi:histidine triad (HIT) family protein
VGIFGVFRSRNIDIFPFKFSTSFSTFLQPMYGYFHHDITMSTIFTKIINREIPSEILYETDKVISIIDIMPIHYGHALIIPKKEYRNFLEVPEDELGELFIITQKVAKSLVKTFNLDGFNFFANNGEVAGQSVFHFHIHVTPRYSNDNISFNLNLKKYAEGQMKEIADKIRSNIA